MSVTAVLHPTTGVAHNDGDHVGSMTPYTLCGLPAAGWHRIHYRAVNSRTCRSCWPTCALSQETAHNEAPA